MKLLTLKKIAAAVAVALLPLLASAAQFYPVITTVHTPSSFKATWTFNMQPPYAVPLYAWIGPVNTDMFAANTQWKNWYLGTIETDSTVPFVVDKSFVYADLNLAPNKVYSYILTSGTNSSAQMYGNSQTTELFSCFTTNGGSLTCPSPLPPSNPTTPTNPTSPTNPTTPTNPTSPTNPPASNKPTLTLISIIANPATGEVTIKGRLKLASGTVPASLAMYTGKVGQSLSKSDIIYTGNINATGALFTSTIAGLAANTTYNYEIEEQNSNTSYPAGTFSTSVTTNQFNAGATPPGTPANSVTGSGIVNGVIGGANSGTAVNGACGPAGSGTPVTVITENSANLCNPGTVKNFTDSGSGTGPWTWNCEGANNGSTASCSATQTEDEDYGEGYLKNPLAPGLDTFPKIFAAVVNNIVLPVAVPFIAIMIIYSGFLFVSARKTGSTDDLKKAKDTLKYTLIGAGLVLGATVIASGIQGTLNEILGPTV